jgi:hypothetical protein
MSDTKHNRSEPDGVRRFLLIDELTFALALIQEGVRRFQARKSGVQDSTVEVFLLSSGLERLLKVCILAIVRDLDGRFPENSPWPRGNRGHNLVDLFHLLDAKTKKAGSEGAMAKLKGALFLDLLDELGDFAETGRYHNINLVLGNTGWMSNPRFSMARLELKVLSTHCDWENRPSESMEDHLRRMTTTIISEICAGISTVSTILGKDLGTDHCKHIAHVVNGYIEDLRGGQEIDNSA